MKKKLIIKNGTIITLDSENRIIDGDVVIEDGVITQVGERIDYPDAVESTTEETEEPEKIDATGRIILPGFVQTHIHLCQTLFRGSADDMALIDWLKKRIWPMEAAHTPESIYASARLGIAEIIRGGTTTALTMESVNHTGEVFRAVDESGFRAIVGKCMMDKGNDVPKGLREKTDSSIAESIRLAEEWHGRDDDRIRYGFAPRFAVSCTRGLLEQVAHLSVKHELMVHTHASENLDEIRMVFKATGKRNIEYLHDVGLTGNRSVFAHCIHLDDYEMELMHKTGTHVSHCPSSNLKLASGIARVSEMLERGISVSFGADGAPCNNRLDMFTEMRTAALLQKVLKGSRTLPAWRALRMATIDGANALGLANIIGSIEPGKKADLQLLNLDHLHTSPHPNPVSAIVYAADRTNIETVIVNGRTLMRDGILTTLDESQVIEKGKYEAGRLFERIEL
ncbi:MAG: 5'-deoxyadenosine deaminase [Acidobacteria bacterium]|nr:5'-deoxyadenosine deaminase [Acidobacteriota bacterium]